MDPTLYNLLLQETHLLLGAENIQAVRLRELTETVKNKALRSVFEAHAHETDAQRIRLEEYLRVADEESEGEIPSAVDGLIEDTEMITDQELGPEARDIAIAAAARKMEHYEIGCYETSISLAEQLGLEDWASSLRQSLQEERRADRRLAEITLQLIRASVSPVASAPFEDEP